MRWGTGCPRGWLELLGMVSLLIFGMILGEGRRSFGSSLEGFITYPSRWMGKWGSLATRRGMAGFGTLFGGDLSLSKNQTCLLTFFGSRLGFRGLSGRTGGLGLVTPMVSSL